MEVIERRADELKPYPGNPRIPGQAVKKVAESIRQFGWRQPIVVDEDDIIIVGHIRQLAAFELDHEMVPVHIATDLSEEQKRAYRLADNRTGEYAGWDEDMVGIEMRDLAEMGFDTKLTGFSETQLRRYSAIDMTEDDSIQGAEARTSSGDLWQCGEHRVLCGDATNEADVAKLIGDKVPILMVTDPPYGVNYDPQWRSTFNLHGATRGRPMQNDDRADWRDAWALFPGDVAYVWHGALHCAEVAESLSSAGFEIRAQIIWAKPNLRIGRGHYHWQHETLYLAARHEVAWYGVRGESHWTGSRGETTLWEMDDDKFITDHPTQKPVEAMGRPMMNSSRPDDYVYDPFAGSGTSIVAAERSGRRCLAMDIDEKFVDASLARWEAETGDKAIKL